MAKKEAVPEDDVAVKKPAGKKPFVIYGIVGILVLLMGVGAAVYFLKSGDAADGEHAEEEQVKLKASYFSLEPAYVVNFKDENNKQHLLQVKISIMHRDPRIDEMLKTHGPLIRSNLLVLLSSQDFSKLQTQTGKNELAEKALEEVQGILQEEEADDTLTIERVLFTDFVMQ